MKRMKQHTCGGLEMSGREGSRLFNTILDSGRMPEGWTSSIQVLISITRVMCRAVLSTDW